MFWSDIYNKQLRSWKEIQEFIEDTAQAANIGNAINKQKGDFLERFSIALLKKRTKEFNTKEVYLGHSIPEEYRVKLRLPIKDLGQDGLLIQNNGTLVVFQSKYRSSSALMQYFLKILNKSHKTYH
jgi:hypothetical protein